MTLPDLPAGADEPTFEAPWQARAFAVAVVLSDHHEGVYSWTDFQENLVAEIEADDSDSGDAAGEETDAGFGGSEAQYYEQWLRALERVVLEEGLVDVDEVSRRVAEFAEGDRDASEFVEGEHDHPGAHHEHEHDHHSDRSEED